MEETSDRIDVYEKQIREQSRTTKGAESWKHLSVANAIQKNQWLLLTHTYMAQYETKDKASILDAINSARDELRSYLIISATRDQISGVLDALEYGEREIKNASFAR